MWKKQVVNRIGNEGETREKLCGRKRKGHFENFGAKHVRDRLNGCGGEGLP